MRVTIALATFLFLACGCSQPQQPATTTQVVQDTPAPDPPATPEPATSGLAPTKAPPPEDTSAVIAFTSERDGNMEIYIMGIDGGNPQRLTDHPGEDYWPTWSPDGAHIAFASERDGNFEIYILDADGSHLRRLTTETGNDLEPAWSPDGERIAFMVHRAGKSDVFIMRSDGSERQQLTDSEGDNYLPKWSPDGAQLVFVSERDGNPEIYIMKADGSDQSRLTDNPGEDLYPSWSPDGSKMTFYSEREGRSELYMMDADGRNPQPLTNDNAPVWVSDWSPDGQRIAFTSSRDGNREIYLMDAGGGNLERLTNNRVLDGIPAWRPLTTPAVRPDDVSAGGLSEAETATLASLEEVADYPLYTMHYQGDYDQRVVPAGAGAAPAAHAGPSWGCALFAALGDEQDMFYGRNFDWDYSPALLLLTDPPDGYAAVSMVDIGYLVGEEAAGMLLELPLAERAALLDAPFWPFDGMNEWGLAIGMAAVPAAVVSNNFSKERARSK